MLYWIDRYIYLYSANKLKESLGAFAKEMCFQRSSERIEGKSRHAWMHAFVVLDLTLYILHSLYVLLLLLLLFNICIVHKFKQARVSHLLPTHFLCLHMHICDFIVENPNCTLPFTLDTAIILAQRFIQLNTDPISLGKLRCADIPHSSHLAAAHYDSIAKLERRLCGITGGCEVCG